MACGKRGNAKNLAKREISFIDLAMKKGENDNQHSLTHRELAEAKVLCSRGSGHDECPGLDSQQLAVSRQK